MVGLLVLAMAPMASAQETTGGIKAYVKDKTGAVVPKATVELSGPALITPRTAMADDAGYVFFDKIPPGEYTLAATAPSFRSFKVTGIKLDVGKTPTFDLALELGEVSQTIEVTSTAVLIDVTSSNVSTAIPQDVIDNVPKGRSFQSLIPFAPGARQEPLQSSRVDRFRANGFQVDGASDSENTYLVEGLDTTNIQSGGVKQNVPFEFVQEVQIKTSGVAAEYGGALGGVVNVIQKRGSNDWHGSVFTYYRNSAFDSNDQCATTPQPVVSESLPPSSQQLRCGLRPDPTTSANQGGQPRLDQAAQYYQQKQDKYYVVEPGFTLGGPIRKNKIWFFASYIPTIDRIARTANFTGASNPGPRTFYRSNTSQNGLARLDYQPLTKLRLYSAWQYGYSRIVGQLPTFPDSIIGQTNTIASNDPTSFRSDTGSVNPSNIFNFGGDWTPTNKLLVAARYGYFYYNSSDRGKPAGIRYLYQGDLTTGATGTTGLNGAPLIPTSGDPNAQFAHGTAFANIANNSATLFDIFSRKAFSTDLSYSASRFGTHNFKVGYGFNHLYNNVFNGYNTAEVDFYWGQFYTPNGPTGTTNCASIIAQNQTTYGLTAAQANAKGCRGNAGYFLVHDGINTTGVATSYNHSIYAQDSWTVGHGLTLNLGVRFDKEFVPPYSPGASSVSFNFTDKVAPRIGGAYDLFHNGKLKIFASYGKFFDIMKYSLSRGSFGGEYWHDCAYAQDFINYNTITPSAPNGHSCGPTSDPSVGVTVGRFIENYDWRASVINTADPGVDPNIKPMSQHEFVVGGDWAVTSRLGLEVRYARKRLDDAIEDFAVTDGTGFYIGNPGPNTYMDLLHRVSTNAGTKAPLPIQCAACPPQPTAIRRYDGLETRLTYRRGSSLFAQAAYTYSKLRGNYAGLTDTDVTDGSGGRHNPNNHREFDGPALQYTTTGQLMDGPLSTDRPHVLTLTGFYLLKWWGMQTSIGGNQIVASGTPKSTCIPIVGTTSSCQIWEQRGTFANMHRDTTTGDIIVDNVIHGARMPVYSQLDINLGHSFAISKTNEAMRLGFEWNVLNLFNQGTALAVSPTPFAIPTSNPKVTPRTTTNTLGIDFLSMMTGWDPIKAANAQGFGVTSPQTLSSWYGLPYLFQNRRTMRMAVRFTF